MLDRLTERLEAAVDAVRAYLESVARTIGRWLRHLFVRGLQSGWHVLKLLAYFLFFIGVLLFGIELSTAHPSLLIKSTGVLLILISAAVMVGAIWVALRNPPSDHHDEPWKRALFLLAFILLDFIPLGIIWAITAKSRYEFRTYPLMMTQSVIRKGFAVTSPPQPLPANRSGRWVDFGLNPKAAQDREGRLITMWIEGVQFLDETIILHLGTKTWNDDVTSLFLPVGGTYLVDEGGHSVDLQAEESNEKAPFSLRKFFSREEEPRTIRGAEIYRTRLVFPKPSPQPKQLLLKMPQFSDIRINLAWQKPEAEKAKKLSVALAECMPEWVGSKTPEDEERNLRLTVRGVTMAGRRTIMKVAVSKRGSSVIGHLQKAAETILLDANEESYSLLEDRGDYRVARGTIREVRRGEEYEFELAFPALKYETPFVFLDHPQFARIKVYLRWSFE